MTAYDRLMKAADTLNDALGLELIWDVSGSLQGRVYDIHLSEGWFFSVDYVEIIHNSDQGLVNLLRFRLMQTFEDVYGRVKDLKIYVRGTQPWVLVEGL